MIRVETISETSPAVIVETRAEKDAAYSLGGGRKAKEVVVSPSTEVELVEAAVGLQMETIAEQDPKIRKCMRGN